MDISMQKNTNPRFHPSMFESVNNDLPQNKRSMASLGRERSKRVAQSTDNLISPGKHILTPDDKSVSKSNNVIKHVLEETLLTSLFFSQQNIQNIQDIIKFIVHRETKYTIDNQSVNELMIVMRSIFFEYSAHPPLLDDNMDKSTRSRVLAMYTKEVGRLNDIVINAIVPKLISQLQQYIDYLRDAGQQPYQMEIPKSDSVQGKREYRSVTQVLLGGNL